MTTKNSKKRGARFVAFTLAATTIFSMQPQTFPSLSVLKNNTQVAASTVANKEPSTFSWDNANVYFLLTDRFKNGNTSNDHAYGRGLDKNGNVLNYSNKSGTFHGGDFAGITQKIKDGYFNDLGVNALWISAPYEQIHGYVIGNDDSNSFAHYAYHGYYVLDYTNTDANFGTKEEFKQMVDTAHEHGLRVVLDIVMNHTGYNSMKDMSEYNFGGLYSGWENEYYKTSNINNTNYHSKIDYNTNNWSNWWGSQWIRCGLPGYTAGGNDDRTRTLDGLPDFKTEYQDIVSLPPVLRTKWTKEGRLNDEESKLNTYLSNHNMNKTVRNCITYWLQSWVRTYGIDGFRCDTAKHVDLYSWQTLKNACVEALRDWKSKNPSKALDNEDFWMTGEVFGHGVDKDSYYTQGGFDSLINFSTQGGKGLDGNDIANTYQTYANKINNDDNFNVLSYISSHDTTLARGNSIYLGSAFLLLPGAVQTYYGDETDRPYDNNAVSGSDHALRKDMNWDSINQNTLNHWKKVGTFRSNHIAVGAGSNASIGTTNGKAFSRTYNKNGITDKVAFVFGCQDKSNITVTVSSLWSNGQKLRNAYDGSVAYVSNGKVTFNSGSNSTILIEEAGQSVTPSPSVTPTPSPTTGEHSDIVYVKSNFVPYVYAWNAAGKTLAGSWPGTKVTQKTSDGYYKIDLNSKDKYNVVLNNGSGKQTADITNLQGYTKIQLNNDMSYSIIEKEKINTTITIRVKSYNNRVPYLYVWDNNQKVLNGGWPGTKMTKSSDGYYTYTLNSNYDSVNCIVSYGGDSTKSSDITGVSGTVTISNTSGTFNGCKVTRS